MNTAKEIELFNSIKEDNLSLFSSLFKDMAGFSFGRFPILSLCYLYNAKKIIKSYKDKLIKINEYKEIEEPFEIYTKFKKVAGRCLRLYVNNSKVTPIEMLAILNKNHEVKKLFATRALSEQTQNNLKAIYQIKYQRVSFTSNTIKINNPPITLYQKRLHKIALYATTSFVFLISLIYLLSGLTVGLGTSFNAFNVYTQNQLLQALNSNGNYSLQSDITLSDFSQSLNFNGTLNGNNRTLYVSNISSGFLINSNSGKIKNLNVVYNISEQQQISSSLSLFACNNSGEIENVNIKCTELNISCNKSNQDVFVNGFVTNNTGTIKNCNLSLNATLHSNTNGEIYASGFVGNNKGIVDSCIFEENSNIETFDIDVSGIVSKNEKNGQVKNCKNYATLSQTSEKEKWSPNLSGIVLINYGQINNTYNLGGLTVTSNNNLQNAEGSAILGGITSMNYGQIDKCLNKGDLSLSSKKVVAYVGGISAYSTFYVDNNKQFMSSIKNSGVDCNISLLSEDEKAYVFAGGIGGYVYTTEISNCYSLAKFQNDLTEEKYIIGACVGASPAVQTILGMYIYVNPNNNYVLNSTNAPYQMGARLVSQNTETVILKCNEDILDQTKIKTCTEEIIKAQEVYWNE